MKLFSFYPVIILVLLPLLSVRPVNAQESDRQPNIVFILADDAGFSDIGAYGSEIKTPNLDKLAEDGLRFTQMESTGKCFPSRTSILTGLYTQQAARYERPGGLHNSVMLGQVLKSAGYRTLFIGKHHGTDNPGNWGFDHYRGLRDGAANYFNPGERRPTDPGQPAQKEAYTPRTFVFDDSLVKPYTPPQGYYGTDTWTDWAIELLDTYKDEQNPFLLYVSYQAPHDPLQAPEESIQKYEGDYEAGFEEVARRRYERQRNTGLLDERYPRSEPAYRDWEALSDSAKADQARRMQVYAAMIDRMDENIGRIIAKIKTMGEWENTLFIFTSDNGASAEVIKVGDGPIGSMTRWASLKEDWANVANTPFRYYKTQSHEGGTSVPFIVHWPEIIKRGGRVDHTPVHFIDLMPTFIDITGATYPDSYKDEAVHSLEGESLLPIFTGRSFDRDEPLFFDWSKGSAIRTDRWKLVRWGKKGWELYDMQKDRTEMTDLADKKPQIVKQLRKRWMVWARRMGIHDRHKSTASN